MATVGRNMPRDPQTLLRLFDSIRNYFGDFGCARFTSGLDNNEFTQLINALNQREMADAARQAERERLRKTLTGRIRLLFKDWNAKIQKTREERAAAARNAQLEALLLNQTQNHNNNNVPDLVYSAATEQWAEMQEEKRRRAREEHWERVHDQIEEDRRRQIPDVW